MRHDEPGAFGKLFPGGNVGHDPQFSCRFLCASADGTASTDAASRELNFEPHVYVAAATSQSVVCQLLLGQRYSLEATDCPSRYWLTITNIQLSECEIPTPKPPTLPVQYI